MGRDIVLQEDAPKQSPPPLFPPLLLPPVKSDNKRWTLHLGLTPTALLKLKRHLNVRFQLMPEVVSTSPSDMLALHLLKAFNNGQNQLCLTPKDLGEDFS